MVALVLLKGQPGSGKSTLGRALASQARMSLIIKDDARDALQTCASAHPSIDFNTLSYDVMFQYAGTQLAVGMDCIVDSPLARRSLFDRAAALAEKYGAKIGLVEVEIGDDAEWARRLAARGAEDAGTARSHKPGSMEAAQAVLRRNAGSEAWSREVTVPCRVTIDTAVVTDVKDQVAQVVEALQAAGMLESR